MGLVITLKPGDFVNVQGPSTITFLERKGNYAKLHIACDRSTTVERSSLRGRDIKPNYEGSGGINNGPKKYIVERAADSDETDSRSTGNARSARGAAKRNNKAGAEET